jgi:hypothetical protein
MEGRFISKDPIGFEGGINVYSYTLNNPVTYTDPMGLDAWIGGEASGGAHIILIGGSGGGGVLTNVSTGKARAFTMVCGRMGLGIFAGGETKALGSIFGPRCGKDLGGLNVSLAGDILVPGGPGGGNIGYGGGVGAGVGLGPPEAGAGFSLGVDVCWISVTKCWNSPKSCKECQ